METKQSRNSLLVSIPGLFCLLALALAANYFRLFVVSAFLIVVFLLADVLTRAGRGDPHADQAQALFGGFSIGLTGHLGALVVVTAVALLTAVTSRGTVLGHLRRLE